MRRRGKRFAERLFNRPIVAIEVPQLLHVVHFMREDRTTFTPIADLAKVEPSRRR